MFPALDISIDLWRRYPPSQYHIEPHMHRRLGPVYFVQSHAGYAVDDFGRYVNSLGDFLHSGGSMVPLDRLPPHIIRENEEWDRDLIW